MSQNLAQRLGPSTTQSQSGSPPRPVAIMTTLRLLDDNLAYRIRRLFSWVKDDVASLQKIASDQQRENATLRQLQQRIRELQWEKARVKQYLLLEKEKWYPRFLNATRDRRDAFCEGCNQKSPEVHLTRCFHLLCGDCYKVQGPVSVSPSGLISEWTCKACNYPGAQSTQTNNQS